MTDQNCQEYIGPYRLGPYDDENYGIYTGDAKQLSKAIPDESIDLVFCDPVYDQIDDYRWLAETAARVLKPDSIMLVFCGIGWLDVTISALKHGGLFYRWCLGAFQPNGPSRRGLYRSFSKWYACLFFDNSGESCAPNHWPDMVVSIGYQTRFGTHKWRKNPKPYRSWLHGFTDFGSLVFDPFTGGGTVPAVCKMLGRKYLAFEIDPDTAEMARKRVRQTQPPMTGWTEAMQQMELLEPG